MKFNQLKTSFKNIHTFSEVIGVNDRHLNVLNSLFNVTIFTKGDGIFVNSDNKDIIHRLESTFETLIKLVDAQININERDVIYIAKLIETMDKDTVIDLYTRRTEITKTLTGKPIYPKTINQQVYLDAIEKNDLVFAVGPAGTGKTYVAVIHAVSKLKNGDIRKIILTRPAVEAGEKLGFLPGDLKEKIDPYLRPLYDALYEVLGLKQTDELIEKGVIEIAPLAYMRGRTLENAYVILDEAQNTTKGQMKLFLTRMGFNSKMVVTGDITQIDLPSDTLSGLIHATQLLKRVPGIEVVKFERIDVVRHPLVQKILERYDDQYH